MMTDYSTPHYVSDLDAAFPPDVSGTLLPDFKSLPDEFMKWHTNPWCDTVEQLFFNGGDMPPLKDGISKAMAVRHLSTVLRSFEPQHEHKIAGAGYLLSLWCKELTA